MPLLFTILCSMLDLRVTWATAAVEGVSACGPATVAWVARHGVLPVTGRMGGRAAGARAAYPRRCLLRIEWWRTFCRAFAPYPRRSTLREAARRNMPAFCKPACR